MLEKLWKPSSVAVIGASATHGKVGHAILANLLDAGYEGVVVPVNPKASQILGVRAYPDISSYGKPVDLAVVAVPTMAVKETVRQAVKAGVGAVALITAGFKETGDQGAILEKEIAEYCSSRNVRLLGPNCLGVINTHHKLNATFARQSPRKGKVSVISQSGALLTALLDYTAMLHIGIAKMISIGNKADLNEVDMLQALAEDEETGVIIGYLESITDGEAFVKAAERAAFRKPVVFMKAGATMAGQKAARSHTGSLAGLDIAYGSAFARAGVIRADSFESLLDYALALSSHSAPAGKRVAVITNAGGPGIMCADALEKAGLAVAELSRASSSALAAKLPAAASVGNPIDVLGDADPERYATAFGAAQDDDAVDAIIVILTPQAMTAPAETAVVLAENVSGKKPALAVFMGGEEMMPSRAELVERGLPAYSSPERAVAALRAMNEYATWKNRPPRLVTRFPVNIRRAERIIARRIRTGRQQVGEYWAKEILRAYGFNVPAGGLAISSDEAVDVAERIGYPVVMKVASPDIIHKTDFNGVRLGLANAEEVADAFDLITLRISRRAPEAKLDGVYVEKMADRGREVIIGMIRDAQFGPMLMFGLGGIFVEIMKDVAFHLAPITADEAMTMLRSTRSYDMLAGARGQASVDIDAIADGLQRISQLVTDFPQISELDINPLIVGPPGTEPVVVDARLTLPSSWPESR